jgi:hypothetical protein
MLDEFVEHTEAYKEAPTEEAKAEARQQAFEQWTAYLFLKGSDPTKYGTVIKGLMSQYSLGNDQYPKSLTQATDVLSNHRIDGKFYELKEKKKQDQKKAKEEPEESKSASFAQKPTICYVCGKNGHTKPKCPELNKIPEEKWAINRAMKNLHQQPDQEGNEESSKASNKSVVKPPMTQMDGWSNLHMHEKVDVDTTQMNYKQVNPKAITNTKFKDVILLDTGSSIGATFMNPNLVTGITASNEPIQMLTNAGTKIMDREAEVPGFGKVYYDPSLITNIFGFAKTSDKYRITYDNMQEDAFNVFTDDGVIKFTRSDDGLYLYKPTPQYLKMIA